MADYCDILIPFHKKFKHYIQEKEQKEQEQFIENSILDKIVDVWINSRNQFDYLIFNKKHNENYYSSKNNNLKDTLKFKFSQSQ